MEREVHSILGPLGIKESLSRLVAEDLRSVEEDIWGDRAEDGSAPLGTGTEGIVAVSASRPKSPKTEKKGWWKWGQAGREEEGGVRQGGEGMGLTAFLLKFGEGLGEFAMHLQERTRVSPFRTSGYQAWEMHLADVRFARFQRKCPNPDSGSPP